MVLENIPNSYRLDLFFRIAFRVDQKWSKYQSYFHSRVVSTSLPNRQCIRVTPIQLRKPTHLMPALGLCPTCRFMTLFLLNHACHHMMKDVSVLGWKCNSWLLEKPTGELTSFWQPLLIHCLAKYFLRLQKAGNLNMEHSIRRQGHHCRWMGHCSLEGNNQLTQ